MAKGEGNSKLLILILLGLGQWHRAWTFLVSDGWPLIIVIIGVLVLLGAFGRKRKKEPAA